MLPPPSHETQGLEKKLARGKSTESSFVVLAFLGSKMTVFHAGAGILPFGINYIVFNVTIL